MTSFMDDSSVIVRAQWPACLTSVFTDLGLQKPDEQLRIMQKNPQSLPPFEFMHAHDVFLALSKQLEKNCKNTYELCLDEDVTWYLQYKCGVRGYHIFTILSSIPCKITTFCYCLLYLDICHKKCVTDLNQQSEIIIFESLWDILWGRRAVAKY